MTREDHVVALFAEANPVPDPDAISVAIDQRLLVDSIEHWSKEMQETKIRSVDKIERPIRRRSWKLGLAAAVVTTVAVGIGIWLASGGETETPVIDQPLPTVATPEPTAASLEVVQQALGLYEAGDIDGWQALWAPEATWEVITPVGDAFSATYFGSERLFDYPRLASPSDWDGDGEVTVSDIEANSLALFYASGGDWHADCVEDGLSEGVVTCQLSPTTVFGKWEQGNLQLANRASASGGTATIRIVDGRISHYAIVLGVIAHAELTASQDGMREYNGWVEENHPELAGTLFGSSIGQLDITPDNYRQHRQLIDEWSAQL